MKKKTLKNQSGNLCKSEKEYCNALCDYKSAPQL